MDLLRFTTAGSVDDGKSTLIGRLLYDSKSIFEDQYEALQRTSEMQGDGHVNLAYLTDGLRAEREQGITIDVAYRYFATPRRKFIIADTPGHEQYTRNMVTGASTAELAIVLIDARSGVLTQSRRHGFIASLLQIPHMVVAVNKMDLVGYDEEVFQSIVDDYNAFAEKLEIDNIVYVPISALLGDNVVEKSEHTPWYSGPTLLHHLETVKVGAEHNFIDFRFPVQYVIRPHQDFRGFAGHVASGSIRSGEEVVVLPSGQASRIKSINTFEHELEEAGPEDAVVLELEDELDISRGDMIVRARNRPLVESRLDADLCWMGETALESGKEYLLQHTTRRVPAYISKIIYRFNVDTLHREIAHVFNLNDIGRVELATTQPLFFDPYRLNRRTGNFVLIDPDTNNTVGAGMIRGVAQDVDPLGTHTDTVAEVDEKKSPNVVWEGLGLERERREERNSHKSVVVWFTGLSGVGKTTIARKVEERLFERGCQTMLLDGDYVRHGLCGDLGFSPDDRAENIRRVGEVARLFFEQGCVTLCTFVSPYRRDRGWVRGLFPEDRFVEVHVDASLDVLKRRDPKGLYKKALEGEILNFTGVSATYEAPDDPELVLHTDQESEEACVERVVSYLESRHLW
ncbi:MAG TPA: sulfate adenylyltransferase subunit CysN [Rhodothermales bacterium]|nr:sulfate adenylyltransferase subunit CysN [Rhodothermales bacterium]